MREFHAPNLPIQVNLVIKIPAERMSVLNTAGAAFQVPVPSSHGAHGKPVQVRLISPFQTPEMLGGGKCNCISWTG